MKRSIRTTPLFCILFIFTWCASVAAQPQRQMTITTIVKPGMAGQYEDYIRKFVEAANKLGDVQPWAAFQTTVGGPQGEYFVLLPFSDWGDRDSWTQAQQILVKAFGAEEAAKINRAGQAAVQHSETAITQNQPESTGTTGGSIAAFYQVTRTKVIPHKGGDFRLALSKIWKAEAKAAGAPTHSLRRTISGDRWVFLTATPFESGAERDKRPSFQDFMSAQYSAAEIRQILETLQGATVESRWFEVAHRPDLSHSGSATSND